MANVKIYTKTVCPYCVMAKRLFNSKGVQFEEINVDGQELLLEELRSKTGFRTIPQIFIDDEFIGGYRELSALDSKGELDKKLAQS